MFKYDNEGVNRYWRLNVLNEIIEQEIWLNKAGKTGLSKSNEYQEIKLANENNIRINSFLDAEDNDRQHSTISGTAAGVECRKCCARFTNGTA